jgi:hypothetical protein
MCIVIRSLEDGPIKEIHAARLRLMDETAVQEKCDYLSAASIPIAVRALYKPSSRIASWHKKTASLTGCLL